MTKTTSHAQGNLWFARDSRSAAAHFAILLYVYNLRIIILLLLGTRMLLFK